MEIEKKGSVWRMSSKTLVMVSARARIASIAKSASPPEGPWSGCASLPHAPKDSPVTTVANDLAVPDRFVSKSAAASSLSEVMVFTPNSHKDLSGVTRYTFFGKDLAFLVAQARLERR